MSKEIIINHSHHETRVALMEDGMLSELQYEREREQRIVGNIYKGRVAVSYTHLTLPTICSV